MRQSRTFSDRDGADISDATSLSARLRERIIALQGSAIAQETRIAFRSGAS
jgi:hypothetical protein